MNYQNLFFMFADMETDMMSLPAEILFTDCEKIDLTKKSFWSLRK